MVVGKDVLNMNERMKRNNLFKNMIEINYFVIDLQHDTISFEFSQKFRERTGISYDTLDVSLDDFYRFIDQGSKATVLKFIDRVKETDIKTELRSASHLVFFPQSNHPTWMYAILQKVNENMAYGVHIDITELQETQLAFAQAKKEYETILTNATDLIVKYRINGEIVFASQSYAELYNMTVDELKGKGLFSLEHINQKGSSDFSWFDKALEPPYQSSNIYRFVFNDREKWISFYNQAIVEDGEVTSLISIGHDITTIKKLSEQLHYEAHHDLMTGLYNHRGIRQFLDEANENHFYTVYLISINNLQEINDFYGYMNGDKLIQTIGHVLRRYKDIGHVVGRISNSKFVVIAQFSERKIDKYFKNQLIREVSRNFYVNGYQVYVNASVGYSRYPDDSREFQKLISFAELASYEAQFAPTKTKRYQRSMFQRLHRNVQLSSDLRESLDHQGIHVVYQPIIDVKTKAVKYVETLARWKHPELGIIPPNEFIPIAEKASLLDKLDFHIIEHALKDYDTIQDFFPNTGIAINITPFTLRLPNLVERVLEIGKKYDVSPSSICLEISENTFMDHRAEVMKQIAKLRQAGFKVALDDFGSKYSSLGILDDMEVDIIKVDKAFIAKLENKTTTIILKMIKELADLRNKEVVIEGVEEKKQVKFLQDIGFRLVQGYYFSKPQPISCDKWINEDASQ